MNFTA